MQSPRPVDVTEELKDLSNSDDPYVRRRAATRLGQLTTTGEEIVRALAAAQTLDTDLGVRMSAGEALQSPVHQAFLQDRPGFAREAVETVARGRAQEQQSRQEQIIEEFMRRRDREQIKSVVFVSVFTLGWCLVLVLPYEGVLLLLRAYPVVILLGTGLMLWLSWRQWRCPSCDGWLSSWGAVVNPFFSSAPLRCPRCGTRLL